MPATPEPHPYSDRLAFERLMLLIAAIAQNPGIGSVHEAHHADVDPMDLLQKKIQEIAAEKGIEFEEWSIHTLRKDLVHLRKFGIVPTGTTLRRGYYLGRAGQVDLPKSATIPRSQRKRRAITNEGAE